MKLTMEAFKEIKKTCDSFKGLENLLGEEKYREIVSMADDLRIGAEKAITAIETVDEMRRSLKKAGYSDAWYDTLLDCGKIEGLVTFDMPKFFDNNFNREKVCMEGFYDSIVRWIQQAWEFLKKLFVGISNLIHWLAKMMGVTAEQGAKNTEALNKVYNALVKFMLRKHPIELQEMYDSQFICNQLVNVQKLISIFMSGDKLNRVFLNDGTDQVNGDEAKKLFQMKLKTEIDMLQIDYRDPNTTGFTLKYNPSKTKYIYFYNETNGKFPQTNVLIHTIEEFDNLVQDVTEGLLFQLMQQTSSQLDELNRQLTAQRDKMQNIVNAIKTNNAQPPDPNLYTEAQCRVIQCNCALGIVSDMLKYMKEVNHAWFVNKTLVDTVFKTAKDTRNQP